MLLGALYSRGSVAAKARAIISIYGGGDEEGRVLYTSQVRRFLE